MAQIESLYAQELEAEHKKVLGYLKQTQEEILKTNKLSIDFYGGKKASNPNDFKNVTANYDALNNKVEQTTKTIERQRLAEIKLQQEREKAFDKYNNNLAKQEALIAKQTAKQISESQKIIDQKEKEFKQFEKEFNKYEADLVKKQIAEQKANQKAIQEAEKRRLAEVKLAQAREKAFDKYDAQLQKEQAKLNASLSLQAKTTAQLKKVQVAYDELALKKQRYNNLTDNEEKRLITLTNTLQKYRSIQDGVNTTVGKFQQRVGNYATGFNPLSNSINQISREMPAFANSVQTGFMAISNNLPIFFDAMENAIAQQKELQKQGLPSKNALQLLAGSFFTLGTALSLGVTLLTIFAPMLIKSISNSEKKAKAIEAEKKAREEQIQVEKQYSDTLSKLASDEQARSKIYLENAKNTNLPLKERLENIENLQKRYPEYFGNLKKEEILAGNTAKAEYELNNALMKRALFLAVQDKIKETTKELVDAEFKYLSVAQKNYDLDNQYDKNLDKKEGKRQKLRLVTEQEANSLEYLNQAEKDYQNSISKGNVKQQTATDVLRKNTIVAKEKLNILYRILNQNAKYNSVVVEETDKTKKLTKAKRDDVESVIAQGLKSQEYLQVLEEQLKLYKEVQSEVSSTSDEYKAFQNVIDGLQQSIDLIKDPSKVLTADVSGLVKQNEMYLKNKEALEKLQEATDKWLATFKTDFFQEMGLSSLNQFFDGTFDKLIAGADSVEEKFRVSFLAISEVAQEAFNIINQAGQASTQAEIDRLKIQYDTAWEFSDKSDVAKRKLDAEREKREKEIAQKEFKRKQNMAVINIGIDTAQAIMATYGQSGWIGGTAGAIFLGAMGLAQIALVKSQKMPEYEDGTPLGGHSGGLMKINDAKGSNYQEIVKTPDGKLGMFKGRNVVVNAPKGTEVFTAEESMRMLMFDPYLNNMISSTSTPIFKTEIQSQKIDFSPVVDAIDRIPQLIDIDLEKMHKSFKRGNTIQTIERAHTNFSSVKL